MKTPRCPVLPALAASSWLLLAPLFSAVSLTPPAQPYDQMPPTLKIGGATIAAWAPPHEIKDDPRILETLTREIYIQAGDEFGVIDAANHPLTPVPTSDWWTDLIMNGDGGTFWQYPLTPRILADGIELRVIGDIAPWSNGGSRETVAPFRIRGWNGEDVYTPPPAADPAVPPASVANPATPPAVPLAKARATRWSDWMVAFRKTSPADAAKTMDVTLARCMPYVWVEMKGMDPVLSFDATVGQEKTLLTPAFLGADGKEIAAADLASTPRDTLVIRLVDRLYGIHVATGSVFRTLPSGAVVVNLPAGQRHLAVSALPSLAHLPVFAKSAYAKPVKTTVDYRYNPASADGGFVRTRWSFEVQSLRPGATDVLQGWLAPHYRGNRHDLAFIPGADFETPRGRLRCAVAPAATGFGIDYAFNGIMSHLAAPRTLGVENDFDADYVRRLLRKYDETSDGVAGDTYFGAKKLVLHARAMHMAKEMGLTETYENLKAEIKASLADWFTYTEGEQKTYFARNERWGSLVGFNFVRDFNLGRFTDIHFHYGYYTLAFAYVAMDDPVFRDQYKDLVVELAQAYANWDRESKRYPWMRTFEPMVGHSYAAGSSSHSGNNQESSSESIQSWAGLFLLGEALRGNDPRADALLAAGAFGYAIETRAVLEYYQDYHGSPFSSRPLDFDNQPAVGEKRHGIWPDAYRYGRTVPFYPERKSWVFTNGVMGDSGNVFATYFGANPEYVYGIQWLPNAPHMIFLAEDPAFTLGQTAALMSQRSNHYSVSWINGVKNAPGNIARDWYKAATERNPDPRKFAIDNPWTSSDMKGLVQNLHRLNPAFLRDISHEGDPDRDNPFYDEKNQKWLVEFPADRPKDVVFPKDVWEVDALVSKYPHLVPPQNPADLPAYSLQRWITKAFLPPAGPGVDWKKLSAELDWNPADYPATPEGRKASVAQFTTALESVGGSWPLIILTFTGFADPELALDVYAESRRRNNRFAEHVETGLFGYYYASSQRGLGHVVTDQHLSIPSSLVFLDEKTGRRTYMVHNKSARSKLVDVFGGGKLIGRVLAAPGKVTVQPGLLSPAAGFSALGTFPMTGSVLALTDEHLSVVFGRPVDAADAARRITLSGPGGVKLSLLPGSNPQVLDFRVTGNWVPGGAYAVEIPAGVKSATDSLTTEAARFPFTVAKGDGCRLLATTPGDGNTFPPSQKTVSLDFNTRVDPATLAGVTLAGPTDPGLTYDAAASSAGRAVFRLGAGLKPASAYTLTIPASVGDVFGQKLGSARTVTFTTDFPGSVLVGWESVLPVSRLGLGGSSGDKNAPFENGRRWDFDAVGDYAEVVVPSAQAGAYALKGGCKEYSFRGEFRVSVNGKPLEKTWRQYDGAGRTEEDLGVVTLREGDNTLRFEVVAANPAAPEKPWLLIDTLTFTPVK